MTTLPRTLGLRDLILLTIGSVIGSGIFIVPGAVLRQVGGFILALALNTIATQPVRAGIGLGIVLLGAPAYLIWRPKGGGVAQHLVNGESE